ncbi:MAG: hypothetical protein KDI10_09995 [Halioglobus sp.]|nr:hypothetical protein [Halioglobus sp.]
MELDRREEVGLQTVSRDTARDIAENHVLSNGLGKGISKVLLPEEITWRKPNVYGVELKNCWVAYVEEFHFAGLGSSVVVLVDRETGTVIFGGDAGDEG